MKLIIDIPCDLYCEIQAYKTIFDEHNSELATVINGGIPLPKGYGKLMILSEDKLKENQINLDFSCQKWINEVGLSNATVAIIGVDKAEGEVRNETDD